MNETLKLYVIRKYVYAYTAGEAIRKQKDVPVSEVYIDEDWKEVQITKEDNSNAV